MKSQVFGCPTCERSFQVVETQAGQVVQCPSCEQTIEIPANAFGEVPPPPADQLAYSCPECRGQFGVTSSMFGHHVGCPHCQASVMVQSPESKSDNGGTPIVDIESSAGKDKKTGKRWKSPAKSRRSGKKTTRGNAQKKPDLSIQADDAIEPVRRRDSSKPKIAPPPGPRVTQPHLPTPKPELPLVGQTGTRGVTSTFRSDETMAGSDQISLQSLDANPNRDKLSPGHRFSDSTGSQRHDGQDKVGPISAESADVPDPFNPGKPGPAQSDDADPQEAIAHLLPPQFDVLDPAMIALNTGNKQTKVLLPDGKGGTKQVDRRLVRVEHAGEQVSLMTMSEKERNRRRMIQNLIAIVIGIIIMAIAFWLLR